MNVSYVYKSKLYQLICVALLLPSKLRICGFYHCPTFNYKERDLTSYVVNIVDDTLDKQADTVFVFGCDLNQLDLNGLQGICGWSILVDFPTRGNAYLDNCLANRPDVFNRCFLLHMIITTDYTGFVLPAGTKLKPVRAEVKIRNCRKH